MAEIDMNNDQQRMTIVLNFGTNQKEDLLVHFDDKPEDLAEAFVKRHNLNQAAVHAIAARIEAAVSEYVEGNSEMRPQSPPMEHDFDLDDILESPVSRSVEDYRSDPFEESLNYPLSRNPPAATNGGRRQSFLVMPSDILSDEEPVMGNVNHTAVKRESKILTIDEEDYVEPDGSTELNSRSHCDLKVNGETLDHIKDQSAELVLEEETRQSMENICIDNDNAPLGLQMTDDNNPYASFLEADPFEDDEPHLIKGTPSPVLSIANSVRSRTRTLSNSSSRRKFMKGDVRPSPERQHHTSGQNTADKDVPIAGILSSCMLDVDGDGLTHAPVDENEDHKQLTSLAHRNCVTGHTLVESHISHAVDAAANAYNESPNVSLESKLTELRHETEAHSNEDMYNRLKSKWDSASDTSTILSTADLLPSSNIMSLNTSLKKTNGANSSFCSQTPTRRTANDRLYQSALNTKRKNEEKVKFALDSMEQNRKDTRFRVRGKSKQIAENLIVSNQYSDIGHRLHVEGLNNREKKFRITDEVNSRVKEEAWSCSRCGTFQPAPPSVSNVFVQSAVKEKKCINCGWDQRLLQPFQPFNLGAELKGCTIHAQEDKALLDYSMCSEQEPAKPEVFEELHQNTQGESRKIEALQRRWEQLDNSLSFKPKIPQSSLHLLKKHIAKDRVAAAATAARSSAHMQPQPDLIIEKPVDMANYFNQSAAERLYKNEVPSTWQYLKNAKDEGENRKSNRNTSKNSGSGNRMDTENLDRLVYEYKDRDERTKRASEEIYSMDPATNQPYFHPKVVPPPQSKGTKTYTTTTVDDHSRDIFDDILRRDAGALERKKQNELNRRTKEMGYLKDNSAHPLPNSIAILKEATDRQLLAMFKELAHIINIDEEEDGESVGFQFGEIDWMKVTPEMMTPDLFTVVFEARNDYLNILEKKPISGPLPKVTVTKHGASAGETEVVDVDVSFNAEEPLLVTFKIFSKYMSAAISRREKSGSLGASYLTGMSKRRIDPDESYEQQFPRERFTPFIAELSTKLAKNMAGRGTGQRDIGDILMEEGVRSAQRLEHARKEKIAKEDKELTFKPRLYKSNRAIMPTYRYVNENNRSPQTKDMKVDNIIITDYKVNLDGEVRSQADESTDVTGGFVGLPNVDRSDSDEQYKPYGDDQYGAPYDEMHMDQLRDAGAGSDEDLSPATIPRSNSWDDDDGKVQPCEKDPVHDICDSYGHESSSSPKSPGSYIATWDDDDDSSVRTVVKEKSPNPPPPPITTTAASAKSNSSSISKSVSHDQNEGAGNIRRSNSGASSTKRGSGSNGVTSTQSSVNPHPPAASLIASPTMMEKVEKKADEAQIKKKIHRGKTFKSLFSVINGNR